MKPVSTEKLLDIGIALSSEKDDDKLLETILTAAMDITSCDAGTLYIRGGDALAFRIMVTKSLGIFRGGKRGKIDLPPVQLSRANACACAAIENRLINIPDVYEDDIFDFSGPRKYDAMTGYRTRSMLVVPMENDRGEVIGVLQLLNALDENGAVIPFDPYYEQVIRSLASQAAICLSNMNYETEIIELLDSFVRVTSTAIDARSPYNANHTRNMVLYGGRFLDWLDETNNDWHFSAPERRQFLMTVWLHDVGKLVTPLNVMNKESRLGDKLDAVLHRFETIGLLERIAFLEGRIDREMLETRKKELSEARELILRSNPAGFLPEEEYAALGRLAEKTYIDENGETQPWLTADEAHALSVRKGTLTPEERKVMESHVAMTARMLGQMKFTSDCAMVPVWASEHHEFLNGSGYPKKLADGEIPREVRLLTILDIFDALTARDRPYKKPMPAEKALAVLDGMAADGQLDPSILELFKKSEAWKEKKEK